MLIIYLCYYKALRMAPLCRNMQHYISVTNCVSHTTYCARYIDCSLTLHYFTLPLKLPHTNSGPQLDMMSSLLIHFLRLTVHCSTVVCTFVTCGSGRCGEFTGCAEQRLDTCEYPYYVRYVVCSTEAYYAIVLYKQKTPLKIVPITTMAVGYTMDIPADEYTAQLTAQTNAVSRPLS